MPPDLVPADFVVPTALVSGGLALRPLTPEDNPGDYAVWTSSVEHIRATPGFEGRDWPRPMTLDENLGDLRRHAEDFAGRQGFTYTVIEGDDDTVGCVYIYPSEQAGVEADVRSWVRADRAHLDVVLSEVVRRWLADRWPFSSVDYAER